MQNFKIRFHDGKSPIAHEATLELMPDHWRIGYTDPVQGWQVVRWDIPGITTDESFEGLLIVRFGNTPTQTMETREEGLRHALITKYPQKVFFRRRRSSFLKLTNVLVAGICLFVLALLAATYWYLLPFLAGEAAKRIPLSVETKLGDAMYDNVIAGYEVDNKLTPLANAFAKSIDFGTKYPISVTVVKENEVNAFALPGGHIVVFSKIIAGMKTKEELAALLAHEVAHVHYRHSLRNIFRSLGGYMFISLLLNDVNAIVAVLAENSNRLVNLRYSRELETEADEKAIAAIRRNGISLQGFVDLFKLLGSSHEEGGNLKILSSHPLTEDRLRFAKERAGEQVNVKDQPELQKIWVQLHSQ